LRLYPAQSWKGRLFKAALATGFRLGIHIPLKEGCPPTFNLAAMKWFGARPAPEDAISCDRMGVLAGNPNVPGRRYLFLFCDRSGCGIFVAKVGFTIAAADRINLEKDFLLSNASRRGLPLVRGCIEDGDTRGIVLPFIRGVSPPADGMEGEIGATLGSWILPAESPLGNISAWQTISHHFPDSSSKVVRTVLGHGDFAPWNIIVDADAAWHAVDWERGADCWVPGWDWFHYVVQSLILVKKAKASVIHDKIASLCRTKEFQTYARITGIQDISADIFRAYIIYASNEYRQTEGRQVINDLANWALAQPGLTLAAGNL